MGLLLCLAIALGDLRQYTIQEVARECIFEGDATSTYRGHATTAHFRLSQVVLGERIDGARTVARLITATSAQPPSQSSSIDFFAITADLRSIDAFQEQVRFLTVVPRI